MNDTSNQNIESNEEPGNTDAETVERQPRFLRAIIMVEEFCKKQDPDYDFAKAMSNSVALAGAAQTLEFALSQSSLENTHMALAERLRHELNNPEAPEEILKIYHSLYDGIIDETLSQQQTQ